jgi:hypothetical protein
MEVDEFGIEKLKRALGAVIRLGMTVSESLEDDEVTTKEKVKIGFDLLRLVIAVKDFKALKLEFKDITPVELKELILFVETEFDIPNDKAEALIEEAFAMLLTFAVGFTKKK